MRVRLWLLLEEGEYKIHKITHFGEISEIFRPSRLVRWIVKNIF